MSVRRGGMTSGNRGIGLPDPALKPGPASSLGLAPYPRPALLPPSRVVLWVLSPRAVFPSRTVSPSRVGTASASGFPWPLASAFSKRMGQPPDVVDSETPWIRLRRHPMWGVPKSFGCGSSLEPAALQNQGSRAPDRFAATSRTAPCRSRPRPPLRFTPHGTLGNGPELQACN